jgi:hypothetical protein
MVPALASPSALNGPAGVGPTWELWKVSWGYVPRSPPLSCSDGTPSPPLAFITKPQLDPLLLLVFSLSLHHHLHTSHSFRLSAYHTLFYT